MNDLVQTLDYLLAPTSVSPERFREILLRLLDTSVIAFADSQAEAALYNDAIRIQPLLGDYLSILGARLFHDPHFRYLRLYAPGADIPGIAADSDSDLTGLRLRLNQHEVAAALILRFLYDKGLTEGRMDDDGRTNATLEELHTAMKTVLNRTLPVGAVERRSVLRRMRTLKLIDYRTDDDLDSPDTLIVIRPLIVSFVHADFIQAAGDDVPEPSTQDHELPEGEDNAHG